MMRSSEWPQIRAETNVGDAIKILRIISEDKKLEHGHSTPLVFDDNCNLLGFVRPAHLLKRVRHLCEKESEACEIDHANRPVKQLVIRFARTGEPGVRILRALDIVMDKDVSVVSLMKERKLQELIKPSDIFNTVAGLLFDEQNTDQLNFLIRHFHL